MHGITKSTKLLLEMIIWILIVIMVSAFLLIWPKIWPSQSMATTEATTRWPGYYDDGKGLVMVKAEETQDAFRAIQEWRDAHPDRFERLLSMSPAMNTGLCHFIIAYYPSPDSNAIIKTEE